MAQDTHKIPDMAQDGPKIAPKWPQDGPKTAAGRPQTGVSPGRGANFATSAMQPQIHSPRGPKVALRRLRTAQDQPRWAQDGPKMAQDGPRRPKMAPRGPQAEPSSALSRAKSRATWGNRLFHSHVGGAPDNTMLSFPSENERIRYPVY